MAYINVLRITETSIRVNVAGLQTAYESADRVCTWYLNGVFQGTSNLGAKVSSGGTFTFSGLSPGTWYSIDVSIIGKGWDSSVDLSTSEMTDERRIDPWSWWSSNGSATAAQTQAAYTAVTSGGGVADFPWRVWNDLVDKVNEVIAASGGGWDNMYLSLSATRVTSTDKVLTADRFNALRQNIGSRYSTGIQEVSTGDTVYGYYFTTLADKLNEWISRL